MNLHNLTKGEKFIYEWQFRMHGSFDSALAEALSIADGNNLKRLSKGFPEYAEAMNSFHHDEGWWFNVLDTVEENKYIGTVAHHDVEGVQ